MKKQPFPAVELDIQGSAIYRPIDIMDGKVKKFKRLWAPKPVSLTDTRDLFNCMRTVAVDAPLEPISEASIVRACKRMKPRTGLGVDAFTPLDFERPPKAGLTEMTLLLEA
eukprot:3820000-Pyramimonas_sp.AAC.1